MTALFVWAVVAVDGQSTLARKAEAEYQAKSIVSAIHMHKMDRATYPERTDDLADYLSSVPKGYHIVHVGDPKEAPGVMVWIEGPTIDNEQLIIYTDERVEWVPTIR